MNGEVLHRFIAVRLKEKKDHNRCSSTRDIALFYSTHSFSLSKPGAHITHNPTRPTVCSESWSLPIRPRPGCATLTRVTSLESVHQTSHGSLWTHLKASCNFSSHMQRHSPTRSHLKGNSTNLAQSDRYGANLHIRKGNVSASPRGSCCEGCFM